MLKTPGVRTTFGRSDVVPRGRRKGTWTLSKVSKTWEFCSISKNDGRRGTIEEYLQRCIFRGGRSTRDISIRAVRRSGRWFPERRSILEPQIFSFAEMILRDRCSTSYDLASLFRGRRNTLDRWTGKIAKHIGTRPSALHSTFHFWRKSHREFSFLMLSTSKNEEVSQNCFVFDVVNFEKWGSLAELLRFWCCQLRNMRKSRRNSCSHSTAICNRKFKKRIELRTQEQPLGAEQRGGTHSRQKRPQPQPPHTRGTFHRRLQPLYTEKYKVSCSAFLPNTSPMQHSCSHYNAFCTALHQGQSFCDVLLCSVKSHTALHQGQFFCDVLLCSVKSHTALHQGPFFCDVLLCDVKSHTTLHQGQFFCDVLLCSVKSHTTLHQGQVSQFYLSISRKYCFPTSFG